MSTLRAVVSAPEDLRRSEPCMSVKNAGDSGRDDMDDSVGIGSVVGGRRRMCFAGGEAQRGGESGRGSAARQRCSATVCHTGRTH